MVLWEHFNPLHQVLGRDSVSVEVEKASFGTSAVADPVDSVWHIVWVLINPNAVSTKLAAARKWSNREAWCQSRRAVLVLYTAVP